MKLTIPQALKDIIAARPLYSGKATAYKGYTDLGLLTGTKYDEPVDFRICEFDSEGFHFTEDWSDLHGLIRISINKELKVMYIENYA